MHKSSIKKIGQGILDSLEEMDTPKNDAPKPKDSLEPKKKRSFMLTPKQIEMIYNLKAKEQDRDLSDIVGEAIEKYFEEKTKQ